MGSKWGRLAEYVGRYEAPGARVLAVFDRLGAWFAEPGFRGCAWINAYGELGPASPPVAEGARVTAGVTGDAGSARQARAAARALLAAAGAE